MQSNNQEVQDFKVENNVFDRYGRWAEEMLFHAITGVVPSCRRYFHIDHEKAFDRLIEAFGADRNTMIIDDMIHIPRKYQRMQRAAIFITKGMMASWNNLNSVFEIYFVHGREQEAFDKADGIVKACFSFGTEPSVLNLFIQDAGGLRLIEKEVPLQTQDLDKYYNDDLKTADTVIMEKLSDDTQKGIVLLHGAKGSGKTSYLRSIISRIGKKVVLAPADMIFSITSPGLLPHFMSLPGSVIILEDVDAMLIDRNGMGSEFVASLSDFCDGLLSDCVNLKFICTFSNPTNQVDPDVWRKSRVLASYEFEALQKEKCNRIFDELRPGHSTDKALLLAEVFSQAAEGEIKKEKKRIGFK